MKVFIADDSEIVRKHLVAMLSEMEGVEIAGQAEDSREAVDSISRSKPDVVVLDIRMPGGGGIQALELIKKAMPQMIVIMLTNYPEPQYRQKCLQAGAEYFFDKSTEFEKVREVLSGFIAYKGANHAAWNQ